MIILSAVWNFVEHRNPIFMSFFFFFCFVWIHNVHRMKTIAESGNVFLLLNTNLELSTERLMFWESGCKIHTYCYIFPNLFPSFLSLYLPPTLNFIVTFSFVSYILTLIFLISFCINLISFSSFSPYFPPTKLSTLSLSLSLSLSLCGFLFFLIPLIKVYGSFFFLI